MKHKPHIIIAVMLAALCWQAAAAFGVGTYAADSKLSKGTWVKVSVPENGVYLITNEQLKHWGFASAEQVRVYGYGGTRISDVLTLDNYVDDLPMVQSELTSRGIVFYGVGPEKYVSSANGVTINNSNIYATEGYYFLSDTGEPAIEVPKRQSQPLGDAYSTMFTDVIHHEYDRYSPGESGYLLVGESFKAQNPRKFSFDVPSNANVTMECAIVSNSAAASSVEFTVNGAKLPYNSYDQLPATTASYLHGTFSAALHTFETKTDKVDITVSVNNVASMNDCWLDYLTLNFKRPIAMPAQGSLKFSVDRDFVLSKASRSDIRIWDVTSATAVEQIEPVDNDGSLGCTAPGAGIRSYVAWSLADLPSPTYVQKVANQNVHATPNVDMVIFALPEFLQQAERVAQLHRNATSPLSVAVLNVNEVYNEFASGTADVSALRKCLKMLFDRGNASVDGPVVRYAMLMGRATYDNRHLTSQFDGSSAHGTIPCWLGGERRVQMSDNSAFGTDDFIAMLEDGSGSSLGIDVLNVAVGRMPVRTADEAKNVVDKLQQYMQNNKPGTWRNNFLFLADDGDSGIHMFQTDEMIAEMDTTNAQNLITKVYVDAYDIVGGRCVGGRDLMYRMLEEGVVWWNFCGHANNHSWTAESMLTYNDINNMYLSRVPVLMAATCNFLRWDSSTMSGGEILFHERNGGTIATISATRPVYITDNGYFTRAVGRSINARGADGTMPRLGDIYRNAKNNILNGDNRHVSNTNRLRFVLMGDPALKLALPSNIVKLETIDGVEVTEDNQVTLMALQRAELKGSIVSPTGQPLTEFNGLLEADIYDAEQSITTLGKRGDNIEHTYEQHGGKLYSGTAEVVNGRFTLAVNMPGEIADNFRPATISMYAYTADGKNDASGVNRDFYVYGLDESVAPDTEAPVIRSIVLNSDDFKPGYTVNESPMLIAEVSDNVAINLSQAGVGHLMSITLDGNRTYNDVALYYSPASDGSASGSICYPLKGLVNGAHTARLRIWDTAGNSAVKEIDFFVQEGLTPSIYDVYTDANPAITEANFYVRHDRPDQQISVTVGVYNLLGRKIWEGKSEGRSDMFVSSPVTWNLRDASGQRVPRGIYLYRASISTDKDETFDTASRKIGVAAE